MDRPEDTPIVPPQAEPPVVTQPTYRVLDQQTVQYNTQKNTKALKVFGIIFGIIIIAGLGLAAGVYIQSILPKPNSSASLQTTNDGNATVTSEERSIANVAAKVSPSVVSIITEYDGDSIFDQASQSAGTGIIVSKNGYVLTNNHVVEDASSVTVLDSAGNEYKKVEVVGRDPLNDVAFLKIEGKDDFVAAEIGNSSSLRIGQQVVAIGNALGQYDNTVTSGIVSGTGRPITASSSDGSTERLTDLIQTDASINPGNSGGPLVNMTGQVIGINTAVAEDANGIGFAIPINATKGMLAGVLETGKIERSFLGVNYVDLTPSIAKSLKLDHSKGAYIRGSGSAVAVASGSPAQKGGLKADDTILKINEETVGEGASLSSVIGQYRPGDVVTVTYLRSGNTETTQITFSAYK